MEKYNEIYLRPVAMNMVEINGRLWMSLINRNGICVVDRAIHKARIHKIFTNDSLDKEYLYGCVEKAGNQLIFAPGCADNIAIYDLEMDEITYIPLKKMKYGCKMRHDEIKFWDIFLHEPYIYLLGYSYPAIIKIDIESKEIIYITDWLEEVERNIKEGTKGGYFGKGHVVCEDLLLIPIGCMRAMLEINIKDNSTRIRKLDIPTEGIRGLSSSDGEKIWIVGKQKSANRVFCWNRLTEEIAEFQLYDMQDNLFLPFYEPICVASKVFLMPESALNMYEIDVNTGRTQKCSIPEKLFCDKEGVWSGGKAMASTLLGDWIVFFANSDLAWCEYNVISGELQKYPLCVENNEYKMEQYYDNVYSNLDSKMMIPERKIPLEYVLNSVLKREDSNVYHTGIKLQNGKKIYEQICGNVFAEK